MGLHRIRKQNDTTEPRQDWGRARVNAGVVAEGRRETKLSGNKLDLTIAHRVLSLTRLDKPILFGHLLCIVISLELSDFFRVKMMTNLRGFGMRSE